MKQSRATYIMVILIAAIVVALLLLFNEIRRRMIIGSQQRIVKTISEEITEVQELGFGENESAIRSLSARLQDASEALNQTQAHWFLWHNKKQNTPLQTHLQELIALHTKMLESYRLDLRDWRKLGIDGQSSLIQFTQKQIAKLQRKLEKLQHNRRIIGSNIGATQETLNSLGTVAAKSVARYKQELKTILATGVQSTDPRVCHLKSRLNDRIRYTCQIDQLSGR